MTLILQRLRRKNNLQACGAAIILSTDQIRVDKRPQAIASMPLSQ